MVWLMGKRSKLSICLTNLRHMGHLTLRFLDKKGCTYKIYSSIWCRKCVHNESWS